MDFGGKSAYLVVIGCVLAVLAAIFFPTIQTVLNSANTTGWKPITSGAYTILPYFFLGLVGYVIVIIFKGRK